ncbi:amidohydrolase family protein [Streptomyces litchfieldiae]|uniref:Amidohydrolase family protein n=1 Tax=Streptomyces litchfieldiae TaxID=3075543 RepID=A0ABU2MP27_9ACTN|nr:amidohydrolase family protein [Streptomyces sp. DSM 44938]MDT0342668.1 amidohydrolase family protein [Streptomyces sp. DSM 44938]
MHTNISRRAFLQTTATAATATAIGLPTAAATPSTTTASTTTVSLSLTAATNGSATLSPSGDRLIAEVQNILWSVPREGGAATPLTPPDLEPTRPTFSPDGQTLAVCAYRGGGFHLWTLNPDGSGLRQLTDGPFDDRAPAWSPDGTRIAFASERAGDTVTGSPYRIWVIDVRTGALTQLTGLPGQDGPLQGGWYEDFDPTWSPDGRRLFFVRGSLTTTGTPTLTARTIASVPADGAGAGPVTTEHTDTGPATAQLMTPAVSPDGRLAYLRTTPAPAATCTLVVDGAPVPVEGQPLPVPPRWISRDDLLLTAGGQFRIVRPDTPDATPTEIPFTAALPVERPRYRVKKYDLATGGRHPVRSPQQPALSPDGRTAAFIALNALWTAPVSGRGTPRKIVQAASTRYVAAPSWSPDGRSLLYSLDDDGLFAIHQHDLATGDDTVLATGGRMYPALSPDGGRLACLDLSGNLLLRDLATGEERVLATPVGTNGLPGAPSWSPDGRYLTLVDRNRLNQRFREGYNLIRIVNADTGSAALHALEAHLSLSDRFASGPTWSPDGHHLAVIAESALWLLPVAADGTPAAPPRQLTTEAADHPTWSGDSRTLLYASSGTLRTISVDGGTPSTVPVRLTYRRPTAPDTVLHAGRLWDGTGENVLHDADLVIRGGRITAIEPHRATRPAARRIDASDKTVIPGLWDSHTHPYQYMYGGRQTALQLAYGITTAVSLGGFAYEQARIREAAASGDLAGPHLLATGELLDGSRVAYSMGRAHGTREGLLRSLDRAAALDWDFVKTYVRAPGWLMAEAADFAHNRLGVLSGSHLCTPGVQLGQDLTTHLQATQRLEYGHATTATGRAYQDLVEIYTATGTAFHLVATPFTALALLGAAPGLAEDPRVTTLMPPWDITSVRARAGTPPTAGELAALDTETAIYRRILAAGGLIALGTDQPLVPVGLHLHLALRALHRAGLTPAEALRTATALPARVYGADADLGTLTEGRLADATIIDGDPFTDFDSLIRTTSVLRGGTPFHQSDLVAAFADAGDVAVTAARGGTDWEEVGHRMRSDSCCDTGH